MESKGCIQDCLLVREAQGGNQAAFEQLVRTHDQAVLGLALRITGSGSDAQDIHHEAFLKAYKNLAGFRFERAFSAWVYRIVTNLCLDHLRRNRNRRDNPAISVNGDDLLNQVSDDRPEKNPERQLLRRELSAHIIRALRRLTPRERMVFELKHFQGLKVRTIGEILNSSEGAVKNSLFRATQKLRFHLAMYTNGNNSSIKQRGVNGVNQAAILQQEKKPCHHLDANLELVNYRTAARHSESDCAPGDLAGGFSLRKDVRSMSSQMGQVWRCLANGRPPQ
jgi:RNA polymerase sigma-70 factor (ECF subfamily)